LVSDVGGGKTGAGGVAMAAVAVALVADIFDESEGVLPFDIQTFRIISRQDSGFGRKG